MTQSLAPADRPTAGPGRTRRILRAVAVVSCVPYLALKAAWIAGSRVGIPEGGPLLADRLTPLMNLAYAGRMLVGPLVAAFGVHHFAERSARTARRPA